MLTQDAGNMGWIHLYPELHVQLHQISFNKEVTQFKGIFSPPSHWILTQFCTMVLSPFYTQVSQGSRICKESGLNSQLVQSCGIYEPSCVLYPKTVLFPPNNSHDQYKQVTLSVTVPSSSSLHLAYLTVIICQKYELIMKGALKSWSPIWAWSIIMMFQEVWKWTRMRHVYK